MNKRIAIIGARNFMHRREDIMPEMCREKGVLYFGCDMPLKHDRSIILLEETISETRSASVRAALDEIVPLAQMIEREERLQKSMAEMIIKAETFELQCYAHSFSSKSGKELRRERRKNERNKNKKKR